MRSLAKRYLKYSDSTSFVVVPFAHQGSTRRRSDDDRERNQRDIRKLVRDFGQRARHVIGGRHDDERMEAAIDRPAARLHRIAERIDRRIIEVDAAGENAVVIGRPGARCRSWWCRD